MTDPTRIQVLCVDDHPIVRQGIQMLLSAEPDMALVAEAANGREAIQQFRAHRPDITLMDLQMPGMGGLDAIGAIRAEFPDARIIVLTTYAGDAQAQSALKAGACGYLLKSALHKELLDAIRTVNAGRKVLPSEGSLELAGQVADETLTPAEINVLRFMAQGHAYPEIAKALALSEEAVEAQVSNIQSKLDALHRTLAAMPELERGMVETERAARHAAEAANRAKSEFIAGMSHELRTPLNAILGYAQILRRSENLSPREVTGIATVQRSGEHLLLLIDDMLDLARIEAGKVELYVESMALGSLLNVVNDIIRVEAQRKELRFEYEVAGKLPAVVRADERRLRQVLLNLLNNAVKFTSQGMVALRVTALETDTGHARIRFEVQDTGIGIQVEHLERIFRPFEQAADVQRRFGGTGLGLAISRQLVLLMGSDIHVDSRVGAGSRFWFELDLPVALPGTLDTASAIDGISGYEGPRRKVLVVDDIEANRAPVVDYLAHLGFEMLEADSGDTAIRSIETASPDLVLMDSVMPAIDGMEAIRRLRGNKAFRDLPIIVVSASASGNDRQSSLAAGANEFLPKPLDYERLLPAMAGLLDLTWTRHSIVVPVESAEAAAPLVAPPPDELEELLRLARIGNMRRIRAYVEQLATLDVRLRPLAARVSKLVVGFETVAIVKLLTALQEVSPSEGTESRDTSEP
ncbi:MAG TPA: response regulator [Albitalea sp.]|uniref:response regulator n=1 Tax=Piscinibacter sp. TaxID=1903157 RepID=UPI002ED4A5A7